eukprot:110645-Pleurochrysis_carterae.AAC.1
MGIAEWRTEFASCAQCDAQYVYHHARCRNANIRLKELFFAYCLWLENGKAVHVSTLAGFLVRHCRQWRWTLLFRLTMQRLSLVFT